MINTLTLNPSIDRVLRLGKFQRNITNRLTSSMPSIGGKGTHVSINLRIMGTPSRAYGFAFGPNGRRIMDMLADAGVTPRFIYGDDANSRDNYVLIEEDTGDCTLIAEKGPQPDEKRLSALFDMLQREIEPGDDLALSGDVSNFSGEDIYSRVVDLLSDKHPRVFLDASGPSLLMGIHKKPFLIKPNLDELSAIAGRKLTSEKDITDAILHMDPLGIEIIAVSLGDKGSIVRAGDTLYRTIPPRVRVSNTIGCGDCFIAGLLHAFQNQFDMEAALRFATAASAAKAECPACVGFDMDRALELLNQVSVTRI